MTSPNAVGAIMSPGMRSSLRQDWATPRQLFYFLEKEFRFTLDVCGSPENHVCKRYFANSALSADWVGVAKGGACWMNPPYGRKIGAWIHKAYTEARRGATVVCLLPARTDTSWWHDYCMHGEVRFLRGRLRFDNLTRGRAPFPSAIVVFKRPEEAMVRGGEA